VFVIGNTHQRIVCQKSERVAARLFEFVHVSIYELTMSLSRKRRTRPMTGTEVLEHIFHDRDSGDSDIV